MRLHSCNGRYTQLAVKKGRSWAEGEEERRGQERRGKEEKGEEGNGGKGREGEGRKGKGERKKSISRLKADKPLQ